MRELIFESPASRSRKRIGTSRTVAPERSRAVGDLDLEAEAGRLEALADEALEQLAPEALEAAGEVPDRDAEDGAGVPGAAAAERSARRGPSRHAAAGDVAGAEHEVGVRGGRDERRDVRRVVREVGVHLHDELGAARRARARTRPRRRGRDRPSRLRWRTSTDSSSAASRSAISPVPSGEESSTIEHPVLAGGRGQLRQHPAHEGLEVLGLVVGGDDEPGGGARRRDRAAWRGSGGRPVGERPDPAAQEAQRRGRRRSRRAARPARGRPAVPMSSSTTARRTGRRRR